jgi:uncharacterized protein (TIGR03435 family)
MVMKRVVLWIAAFVLLSGNSLFAQSLIGTWQATLTSAGARVVIKVSATQSGGLNADMYSVDRDGQPIHANAFSLQGSTVRISLAPIGVKYEGTLSADGNTISGAWQRAGSQQATFLRATPATAWTIPDAPPPLKAMPVDADPSFEVATVKPSPPDATGRRFHIDDLSGRMTVLNNSLSDLIIFAYNIHSSQLKDLPGGLGSARFDIVATSDTPGQPNDRQVRSMLRKLIAERFMLAVHYEKKEMSVYAIGVAKSGPKLTRTQFTGTLPSETGTTRTVFTNAMIADLAGFLQAIVLDRPVVDQSGMEGRYDFTLNWTADESQFRDSGLPTAALADPNAETFPDLFTAVQQQLGLKLESTRARVDILVIDHVEKPTQN